MAKIEDRQKAECVLWYSMGLCRNPGVQNTRQQFKDTEGTHQEGCRFHNENHVDQHVEISCESVAMSC